MELINITKDIKNKLKQNEELITEFYSNIDKLVEFNKSFEDNIELSQILLKITVFMTENVDYYDNEIKKIHDMINYIIEFEYMDIFIEILSNILTLQGLTEQIVIMFNKIIDLIFFIVQNKEINVAIQKLNDACAILIETEEEKRKKEQHNKTLSNYLRIFKKAKELSLSPSDLGKLIEEIISEEKLYKLKEKQELEGKGEIDEKPSIEPKKSPVSSRQATISKPASPPSRPSGGILKHPPPGAAPPPPKSAGAEPPPQPLPSKPRYKSVKKIPGSSKIEPVKFGKRKEKEIPPIEPTLDYEKQSEDEISIDDTHEEILTKEKELTKKKRKIKRYGDIECPELMMINKESIISVIIRKELERVTGTVVPMEITLPTTKKLPELEIFILGPGFDVKEPRKKLIIPLDEDSKKLEFLVIPKELGKKYLFIEFYQEGKMIGRAIIDVIIEKEPKSKNTLKKEFNFAMQSKVDLDLSIRIIRYENKFIFNLFTKHAGTIMDPRSNFGTNEIDDEFIKQINEKMKEIALDFDNPETGLQKIIELGKMVYDLIPKPMQEAIKKINPHYLIFETGDLFVPFEYAHDGEDFLCLKYCIGKRILDETRDFSTPPICFGAPEFEFAIIESNPYGDLDLMEKDDVKNIINKYNVDIELLEISGLSSNKETLKKLFTEQIEIIHICGHGRFDSDNPDDSGILLNDGVLTAKEIKTMKINGFPLIFANACESASVIKNKSNTGVAGIARSFLGAGAIGFIGPLWQITDDMAAEFAKEFYKKILIDQISIGDAIRQIKNEFKSKYEELLWASFNYFGDPTLKLCPKIIQK
ncbi:MAG: CHAT domain-containing protein [Candidatus Helarchaeota archaeon]